MNHLSILISVSCLLHSSTFLLSAQETDADSGRKSQAASETSEWESLFDGKSMNGWRDFRGSEVSAESWVVEEGCLSSAAKPGSIVTETEFENFELKFEWKVSEAANSGIFYRVNEDVEILHESGLEYQVLDNVGQSGRPVTEQAGACYGVIGPKNDLTRPSGEWNTGKIVVDGDRVQHYLNGELVVEYQIGSDDYNKRVKAGPLRSHAKLAKTNRGPISLQNYHGHQAWFRNLMVRELTKDN